MWIKLTELNELELVCEGIRKALSESLELDKWYDIKVTDDVIYVNGKDACVVRFHGGRK